MAAGGTFSDAPALGFDQADTTVSATALLVKMSGDHSVVLAGLADDPIGVSYQCDGLGGFGTALQQISVLMLKPGTTRMFTAAGVIAQNAPFYRAASGKVSATQNGKPLGLALEAASGNGSVFSGLVFGRADKYQVADPGTGVAIPVPNGDFDVMLTIGSAGAETNTLAAPLYVGQKCRIFVDTIGTGTRAITVAQTINVGGNTIITAGEVRDFIELVGVTVGGTLKWQNVNVATMALS